MKVALIILALAYIHIGRGSPVANKEGDKAPEPAAAPAADHAPQAAPAADVCKVNINGREETLNLGDRYCKDDTTNGVCSHEGKTYEFPCDPGFKCHKHAKEWKITCLQLKTNEGIKYGEDGNGPRPVITVDGVKHDAQHDNAQPQSAPQSDSAPSHPAPAQEQPANPVPRAPQHEEPAPVPRAPPHEEPAPVPKAPPHEEPAPVPRAPPHEEPAPPQAPKPQETAPTKPETCKATINGQEQTLQPGDRYCLTETTNRVCNWGEFVDFECPSQSKCLKSPDKWQVLCRIVNHNHEGLVDQANPVPRN